MWSYTGIQQSSFADTVPIYEETLESKHLLHSILLIDTYHMCSLKQFQALRPAEQSCYETAFAVGHKLK